MAVFISTGRDFSWVVLKRLKLKDAVSDSVKPAEYDMEISK